MIIILFLIGFILGLAFTLIGEKIPLLIPEVNVKEDNSWILNLFIAISNALVFLVSFYEYGFSYEFLISIIISCLVITIFVSDFKYMIILDSPLIVSLVATLILKGIYFGGKTVILSIVSGIVLFIFMYLIGLFGSKVFKKEALGGGDIKLAGIIGVILGFRLGLIAIVFSSLFAMPYAIATIFLNKNKEVPFGPFIVGSMAIVFIFMDKFTNLINFIT